MVKRQAYARCLVLFHRIPLYITDSYLDAWMHPYFIIIHYLRRLDACLRVTLPCPSKPALSMAVPATKS